ncbi:hypothetical protein CXB51_031787 [Gossypium anomalum]|uniref:DUF4283 domain-containing protein n=1 Tax=Gossypium anomalum TaxID=47600 RepID=A0A8J5YC25_9ROSI|nr:hypothetical protein CXB51_031787 [Gossypium anomalum]
MEVSLTGNSNSPKSIEEDLIPRKVRFRDKDGDLIDGMKIDSSSAFPISWKDMLVGPAMKDRIHQILFQDMENTVILKLLGRNIGFSVLQNKIYSLWKPSAPLHMMDINNGYFLVKFQNKLDCEKVRFPALPSYLYNRMVITEIGKLVGKVVKLDMNPARRARGRFAILAVYVNLDNPLISHILINGRSQKVEYESLSTICFHCGRYDHVKDNCSFSSVKLVAENNNMSSELISENSNLAREEPEKNDEN